MHVLSYTCAVMHFMPMLSATHVRCDDQVLDVKTCVLSELSGSELSLSLLPCQYQQQQHRHTSTAAVHTWRKAVSCETALQVDKQPVAFGLDSRGGAHTLIVGGLQEGDKEVGCRTHVVLQAPVEDVCQGCQQPVPPAQADHLQRTPTLSWPWHDTQFVSFTLLLNTLRAAATLSVGRTCPHPEQLACECGNSLFQPQ